MSGPVRCAYIKIPVFDSDSYMYTTSLVIIELTFCSTLSSWVVLLGFGFVDLYQKIIILVLQPILNEISTFCRPAMHCD